MNPYGYDTRDALLMGLAGLCGTWATRPSGHVQNPPSRTPPSANEKQRRQMEKASRRINRGR